MRKPINRIALLALICLYCESKPSTALIDWGTKDVVYEDFPLFLRKPNYRDVLQFQKRFPRLFTITQILDEVKPNGLPQPKYNESLMPFDEEVVKLFTDKEGLFILVETFAGKRHYYFYIAETLEGTQKISELRKRYPNFKVITSEKRDDKWQFLREYPERLY